MNNDELVNTTKNYYDSYDADHFYHKVWGSEDIHIGIYDDLDEDIFTASQRTVKCMASLLPIDKHSKVLDIGAGYGGAARYLASNFKCHITCLNLSDKENKRNQIKNKSLNLSNHIDIFQGNFEKTQLEDDYFDIVWSEEALLHSGDKSKVFKEVARVLKTDGYFIFSDAMQTDHCPADKLQPILDRIHLKKIGSVSLYRKLAENYGLHEVEVKEMPEQLTLHYSKVQKELKAQYNELLKVCSKEYLNRMDKGLSHWINGGQKGYLNWGILLFKKSD
ncbi:MAG: methyltransferase domain-containing protein [Psychroflexus sp.]|jgi:sarcosine/dimethylglycine N-methyltransferase|nr:methyltransferase domain-containing protein [Psychroflexus sp.]